ncbi:hypothetical protein [Rhodococcus sp. NPDC049939]|uniref:hypothetical protein n=1 Tax=Rhodococcus sp. NPDC049939 TaxID=3155511 RepID=UPI0033CB6A4A
MPAQAITPDRQATRDRGEDWILVADDAARQSNAFVDFWIGATTLARLDEIH